MEKVVKKDKKVLTIFLLMIPSLLIAMAAAIGNYVVRLGFQIILILLQFILIKNLTDDFYGE